MTNAIFTHYEKIRTLTDFSSDNDPEETPYKSLYEAKDLINCCLKLLKPEQKIEKICLNYQLGINYKLTNEIGQAKSSLENCLNDIRQMRFEECLLGSEKCKNLDDSDKENVDVNSIEKVTALIKTHILQDLAICISLLGEPSKALNHLQTAHELVEKTCDPNLSISIDEKLCRPTTATIIKDVRKKRINAALLQTVFCLGQAYQQSEDLENASIYLTKTLQLQYEMDEFTNKKWAIDCAALSQYFLTKNHFSQAAMCLESAEYILSLADKSDEKIKEAKADLTRCWVRLVVNFMEYAAVAQIRQGGLSIATSLSISNDIDTSSFSSKIKFTFMNIPLNFKVVPFNLTMLQKPLEVTYDNLIKDIFQFAHAGIKFAKTHFNIKNGFVTDAVELAQDECQLYQYLACFQTDYKKICKILKRRFRILQPYLMDSKTNFGGFGDKLEESSVLSEKYYGDLVKQMWYTSSEIFADIMSFKKLIYQSDGSKQVEYSLNLAGMRTIRSAQEFENHFQNDQFINDSERRAYLLTIMRKARTWQTLISDNNQEKALFYKNSKSCFSKINNFPNFENLMKTEEKKLCLEFEQLLPVAASNLC